MSKQFCIICNEDKFDDETHFGVKACRACAAFFRRSIAQNRNYTCRRERCCPVSSQIRAQCRACRLAKCLKMGMRRIAVQKFRDTYGRRDDEEPPRRIDGILKKFLENYTHIESIRRIVHHAENGDSVFKTRQPKAVTYKEASRICSKECDLIADCVKTTFPDFDALPSDQKNIVFRNFFLPFIILQDSYCSSLQNRRDIIILGNGDYIDAEHPETFYHDPEGGQAMTSEDAVKMFASSFANYCRNVTDPMIRENVDKFEFLALVSLVLFDPGLEGQSEQCIDVCRKNRETIHKEILNYYKTSRNLTDPISRLAFLMSLLPALQRATRRFQEDVAISDTFNVYACDEKFYEIRRG